MGDTCNILGDLDEEGLVALEPVVVQRERRAAVGLKALADGMGLVKFVLRHLQAGVPACGLGLGVPHEG